MKTATIALLSTILVAAVQAASPGDVSWYDPIRKATCTGHADGTITCQAGQVEALLKPDSQFPGDAQTQAGHVVDADKKSATVFNTRQEDPEEPDGEAGQGDSIGGDTCAGEGLGKALGCFVNCVAQGFCTAKCDAGNVCQCSCKDAGDKQGLPCQKSSC